MWRPLSPAFFDNFLGLITGLQKGPWRQGYLVLIQPTEQDVLQCWDG